MKFKKIVAVVLVNVLCLTLSPLAYSAQLVDDPGMEATIVADGGSQMVYSWGYWGHGDIVNPLPGAAVQPASGNNMLLLNSGGYVSDMYMDGQWYLGAQVHNTTHLYEANTQYTLAFDIYGTDAFSGGWVQLLSGPIAETSFSSLNLTAGQWNHVSLTGTTGATVSGNVWIMFLPNSTGSTYVDNVTLTVPEPATLSILGAGLIGLLRRKRAA